MKNKIAVWNLEPKYKNLAIEKIRIYHQKKGDEVEDYIPLFNSIYDKIYVSSIFTFTSKNYVPKNAICGGSGFDLITELPEEIEKIKPHLNFGFTTRGCNRNCKWCIVPKKEGKIKIVGDLLDIWDGKNKLITLHDNNILFAPDHFKLICRQSKKYKLTLDFNQGLDHKLLNEEIVWELKNISHKEYYFAFDHPSYYKSVKRAIKLLKNGGINIAMWFVLVGFNTTLKEDLIRLNFLKNEGQDSYVMVYNKENYWLYSPIAYWTRKHDLFRKLTLEQLLDNGFKSRKSYKIWKEIINESMEKT